MRCIACRAMDGGHGAPELQTALKRVAGFTIEIVKRSGKVRGFERTITSAEARVYIAHIRRLARRLARV